MENVLSRGDGRNTFGESQERRIKRKDALHVRTRLLDAAAVFMPPPMARPAAFQLCWRATPNRSRFARSTPGHSRFAIGQLHRRRSQHCQKVEPAGGSKSGRPILKESRPTYRRFAQTVFCKTRFTWTKSIDEGMRQLVRQDQADTFSASSAHVTNCVKRVWLSPERKTLGKQDVSALAISYLYI